MLNRRSQLSHVRRLQDRQLQPPRDLTGTQLRALRWVILENNAQRTGSTQRRPASNSNGQDHRRELNVRHESQGPATRSCSLIGQGQAPPGVRRLNYRRPMRVQQLLCRAGAGSLEHPGEAAHAWTADQADRALRLERAFEDRLRCGQQAPTVVSGEVQRKLGRTSGAHNLRIVRRLGRNLRSPPLPLSVPDPRPYPPFATTTGAPVKPVGASGGRFRGALPGGASGGGGGGGGAHKDASRARTLWRAQGSNTKTASIDDRRLRARCGGLVVWARAVLVVRSLWRALVSPRGALTTLTGAYLCTSGG